MAVNSYKNVYIKSDTYDFSDDLGVSDTKSVKSVANNIPLTTTSDSNNNKVEKNDSVKLDVEINNSVIISLPREKCMKCREKSAILLCTCTHSSVIGLCTHKFCQTCFRQANTGLALSPTFKFICPCCHIPLYQNMRSIEEAILIGEAATLSVYLFPHLSPPSQLSFTTEDDDADAEDILSYNDTNKVVIEKLEAALQLNPTNFDTLYSLFLSCSYGHTYLISHNMSDTLSDFYSVKLFDYSKKLLGDSALSGPRESIRGECYHEMARVFSVYRNHPAASKYAKLAFDHTPLSTYKQLHLEARAAVATMPPLRFAVGDKVECLVELATRSVWGVGKVVELYFREKDVNISFTASYCVQLLNKNDLPFNPPKQACVKADIDRYIRKVGVRSIEDSRHNKLLLDAKVAELSRVYCSEEFIQDVYRTLAQDAEFLGTLRSHWQIELKESLVYQYHSLVMHRQPLVHNDAGYHLPTVKEVIADIRAFFDPSHLSSDCDASTASGDSYSEEIRADLISMFRGTYTNTTFAMDASNAQGLLLGCMWSHLSMRTPQDPSYLSVSAAISRVCTTRDLISMLSHAATSSRLRTYLAVWIALHTCLENPDAGPACECPFVYYFVKHSFEYGWGVPKLALALYDRMNMQLCKGFIRCGNPTCEHNRLDKSTGWVKFQMCSRCKAVIYCSKECQTAHYPAHMKFCREHAIVKKGS